MEDKATLAHCSVDVSEQRLIFVKWDKFNLDFNDCLRQHKAASVSRATMRTARLIREPHHSFEKLRRPLNDCQFPTLYVNFNPVNWSNVSLQ